MAKSKKTSLILLFTRGFSMQVVRLLKRDGVKVRDLGNCRYRLTFDTARDAEIEWAAHTYAKDQFVGIRLEPTQSSLDIELKEEAEDREYVAMIRRVRTQMHVRGNLY